MKITSTKTSGTRETIQCGNCGHTESNVFVTGTHIDSKRNYVFTHFKALPRLCGNCNTANNLLIKNNA